MTSSDHRAFDVEALILELRDAVHASDPAGKVRSIMDAAFADPARIAESIPDHADDDVILFEDDSISIWHCRFQPRAPVPPHNHEVSGTIGVYAGVEKNTFYKASTASGIEASNEIDMEPGSLLSFGPSAIHSVECISDRPSCGIHVYLGPLTKVKRDLYDLSTGEKFPFTDEVYERLTGSRA